VYSRGFHVKKSRDKGGAGKEAAKKMATQIGSQLALTAETIGPEARRDRKKKAGGGYTVTQRSGVQGEQKKPRKQQKKRRQQLQTNSQCNERGKTTGERGKYDHLLLSQIKLKTN